MRRPPPLSLSLALLVSGCIQDLLDHLDEQAPDSTSETGSSSTVEPATPTTGDDPGVQTVTGELDTSTTAAPDTDAPANVPPTIVLFDGIPDHISEAGPVLLQLHASVDVSEVRLSLDAEVLADDLTPADFPREHVFESAKDNGPARTFEVEVRDDEGLTATASATVAVLLPASGAEKCVFEDPAAGAVVSVISALKYTQTAIVAVGSRDTGAGPRLTLWRLDPNTCLPLDNGPRTLANWTAEPTFAALTSVGAAIDVDANDNLVIAGNFIIKGAPQSYVALLNAGGSLLWEHAGLPGDEVAGVAAATGQFSDRILVVGSRRTKNDPVRTDGAIWSYQTIGNAAFVAPPTLLRAPFTDAESFKDPNNASSEWVRAVVIHPETGNALIVGEREFSSKDIDTYRRAFTARVQPLGALVGAPWTSPAETWFLNDAMRSVAVCGDGFVAGGWTRDEPIDATPQPMMFWVDPDGSSPQQRADPTLAPSQTSAIACDREGKIISAGTRTVDPSDAQVFMVEGPQGPRTVYEAGAPEDDGAGAVDCDDRGFCGWGGYRTENKKPYAVVRVHHP